MSDSGEHLSNDDLAAFAAGVLCGAAMSRAEQHIASCDHCCAALQSLPDGGLARRLRQHWSSSSRHSAFAQTPEPVTEDPAALPPELADHARYRVDRLIGAGGMGRVYVAQHKLMERMVALKVIHRRLLRRPRAVQRFEVEVKAAARLDHPNIVRAFDAEQAGDLHFLVMEYVEGASLANVVQTRGPLTLLQACGCVRQAALGLQHAFEHGMVHRDIKPENLMITRKGQVKILDFGLARLARGGSSMDSIDADPDERAAAGQNITRAGAVLGTPRYIAPEQARDSGEVDIRADIYSLGCTLYFLLTGSAPPADPPAPCERDKSGPEPTEIHLTRSALPSLGLPAAIVPVLQKMTQIDPADRYQTPREVADALGPLSRKSPQQRRRVLRWAGIAAALLVVIGLIAVMSTLMSKPPAPPAPQANTIKAPVSHRGGGPVVLCVLPSRYNIEDYATVKATLARRGVRMVVASTGSCSPLPENPQNNAMTMAPDVTMDTTPAPGAYDAVYFASGYVHLYKDDTPARAVVWKLIDDALAAKKPIAALGQGQVVLVFRGTLKNRTVATNAQMRSRMPDYAGNLSSERVVTDGPIITGADSIDAQFLAERLAAALGR